MNPELSLILCLLDKERFNKYYSYVDLKAIKEISKEIYYIFSALEDVHNNSPNSLTLQDLQAFFFAKYPSCDRQLYESLFKRLSEQELSEGLPEVLLEQLKRRREALKLSEEAFLVSKGEGSLEKLSEFFSSLESKSFGSSLRRVSNKLSELLQTTFTSKGWRWRLNCLNKSLGPLRQGDFGFIFARPETGKTTFLASEVASWLKQGAKVVWLNNEEQGEKVALRVIQAYFSLTLAQLLANQERYEHQFLEEVGDKFQQYEEAIIHKSEVEKLVEDEEPDLVVYDQLTKIQGFKSDREDLRLGIVFQWARELAKRRHAAIGVSQADGTAEGVRYLNMGHVANAKTAVQAEADWVLGIGCVHDEALEQVRYLSISKNKLLGSEETLPELKHGRFEVIINTQQAKYEDIITYA